MRGQTKGSGQTKGQTKGSGLFYFPQQRASQRAAWLTAPQGIVLPRQWRSWVNKPQNEREEEAIQRCIRRGSPYGSDRWQKQSAARLGLESTLRKRGRPKKET